MLIIVSSLKLEISVLLKLSWYRFLVVCATKLDLPYSIPKISIEFIDNDV